MQIDRNQNGKDFTYIDDVWINCQTNWKKKIVNEYKLFNIGSELPVNLLYFIETLEKALGKKALKISGKCSPEM